MELLLGKTGVVEKLISETLFRELRLLLLKYLELKFVDQIIAVVREYAVYTTSSQRESMRLVEFVKDCVGSNFIEGEAVEQFIKKTPYWGRCDLFRKNIENGQPFNEDALKREVIWILGKHLCMLV